jgi:hypothetical protein
MFAAGSREPVPAISVIDSVVDLVLIHQDGTDLRAMVSV